MQQISVKFIRSVIMSVISKNNKGKYAILWGKRISVTIKTEKVTELQNK